MAVTGAVDEANVAELVALAKAGAPEAGPYLVSLCGGRLVRYVGLIAPGLSPADQEVVCERAIERAVKKIDRFDPALGSFDSWVRGYARFVLLELQRTDSAITTDPSVLPEADIRSSEDGTDSVNPLIVHLTRMLSQLPETDQMIIQLRDYEQLSYDAIAELLNVQAAACRQRHVRALGRLRSALLADPQAAALLEKGTNNGD